MTTDDYALMNPDIREVQIGIRNLYKLTIYPLAFAQQVEVSNIIAKAVMEFTKQEVNEAAMAGFIINLLVENAGKVIGYVTDPDEVKEILERTKTATLLHNVSNKQLVDIAGILYQDNFEDVSKKVLDLFEKVKREYLSERSVPDSSEDTPSTDLSTLEKDTEKADLQ